MRARRSDYVQLNRPSDVPLPPFDSRSQLKSKVPDRNSVAALEGSSEASFASNPGASFRSIERGPSADASKIPVSYRTVRARPQEGTEDVFGASHRIAVSDRSLPSGEWNSMTAVEQFAFAATNGRIRTAPLERNPPFCVPGEHSSVQSLAGLWPLPEHASSGDGGGASYAGIGPPGSSPSLRQSSGGSYTESLLSSDWPLSTLSPTISLTTSEATMLGRYYEEVTKEAETKSVMHQNSYSTSWAQQTEQSYNLQLALALRLVATAELTEEPVLNANTKENRLSNSSARCSAAATALRFWVNGSLSYSDRIQDGFYHIWGMNPHIWAICNDTKEGGLLPSLDVLRQVDPSDASMEVVLFDKHGDPHLRDLENQVLGLAYKAASLNELAESLGELVCSLMGGAAISEDGDLVSRWRLSSSLLKECVSCLVIPIGSLSIGLCRHRALLYKALADCVDVPCRITRGCKYCGLSDGATCLVQCGTERELLVDLIAKPGDLSDGESFLKSLHSPPVNSPLRLPNLKVSEMTSIQMKKVEVDLGPQGATSRHQSFKDKRSMLDKLGAAAPFNGPVSTRLDNIWPITPSLEGNCKSASVKLAKPDHTMGYEGLSNDGRNLSCHLLGIPDKVNEDEKDCQILPQKSAHELQNLQAFAGPLPDDSSKVDVVEVTAKAVERNGGNAKKPTSMDLSLALDGFEIPWEDLILKERIGAGSFGTVHRADWHGSDVAVKILIEQDIQEERLQEFVREVALMKRMRHPNVVLFMGAVTKQPNFSIVTEYLPRGSLFRLMHRAGMREMLDEKRRIRMALDVAKGMNYLHRLNPPIVHRDLKSPNLLVDKTWTVKVCDFGLSRFKGNTFLSSKSAAGTPEWMAPEVLRDELSNEKSDVYSFGVILWELITLQQPWNGLSPAQVVGAVGFQNRRLQIPADLNPEIAILIEACFSDDPRGRPSFASIMETLKSIQKLSVTVDGVSTA